MRKSLVVIVAAAALTLTATGVLVADDFNPPWWRDNTDPQGNRSTYQKWEFDTDLVNAIANDYVNPPADTAGYPPLAAIAPLGEYEENLDGRTGVWPLSGIIDLFLYNYSNGPEKKVWVQLTWMPQDQGDIPFVNGFSSEQPIPVDGQLLGERSAGDGWIYSKYLVVLHPNPEFETIRIEGNIYVDEVVVDTICPEPSTMLLLGTAIPLALTRRRRKWAAARSVRA